MDTVYKVWEVTNKDLHAIQLQDNSKGLMGSLQNGKQSRKTTCLDS